MVCRWTVGERHHEALFCGNMTGQLNRRRSIRLPNWDYRSSGAYFVTICTHQRSCDLENPEFRRVVEQVWLHITHRSPLYRGDRFVVMPNHVHAIVWIMPRDVGARHTSI